MPQPLETHPDVEVISLSSEEEVKPAVKAKAKYRRNIGRINRRLSKAPLMHKYHTIDEYFQKRKIERMYNCSVVCATRGRLIRGVHGLLNT